LNIVNKLVKIGHQVSALDNLLSGKKERLNIELVNFQKGDVNDKIDFDWIYESKRTGDSAYLISSNTNFQRNFMETQMNFRRNY
jgi:hypothetical protein